MEDEVRHILRTALAETPPQPANLAGLFQTFSNTCAGLEQAGQPGRLRPDGPPHKARNIKIILQPSLAEMPDLCAIDKK